MKVDLVMWTKNGAKTLPTVFARIGSVNPFVNIGKRIVIDDGSVDATQHIAKSFGWRVVANEGTGISDACMLI